MLTVLSAGYPFAAVEPDAIGGAEQVLSALDAAIVRAGFRSIVVAPAGSRIRGELRPTPLPDGPLNADVVLATRQMFRDMLRERIQRERPDVIHLHGIDAAEYLPDSAGIPIIVTVHLWPDAYPLHFFRSGRQDLHLVCVSDAQRAACPTPVPVHVIRNGIDVSRLSPGGRRRPAVLMLGRICPEKGFHLGIDAAKEAGLPVVLGGAVFQYAAHQEYFRSMIEPRLNGRVTFVGPLAGMRKQRLLGSVSCLAVPTTVPETSSLVAMEALASGTPVVAFRTPALAELIDNGRTGFLVADPDEMRSAFERVGSISWRECRRAAETRCSLGGMTAGYLSLYQTLSQLRRPATVLRAQQGASRATAPVP